MNFSLQDLKSQNGNYTKKNEISTARTGGALAAMKSGKLTSSTSKDQIANKMASYTAAVIDETTEIMKTTRTDLIFAIDISGSTEGLEGATCAGYNSLISKEQATGFNTRVTTVLFNHDVQELGFRTNIHNVAPLSYVADGGTALFDTIADTIIKVRDAQARDTEKPKNTLFYIMTDGKIHGFGSECSTRHTAASVRRLVKECKELYGWEFVLFGAIDNANEISALLGIEARNSVEIDKSQEGFYNSFISTSQALDDLRTYGKLTDSWANASKKKTAALENKDQKRLGLK